MSSSNIKSGIDERKNGGDALEIAVDEREKNKYKITLPLSYDFEFSPVDDKGNSVPVTSIAVSGRRTIIKTPGSTSQWKLVVTKPTDQANTDPTGSTAPPDPDESGDGFVDWLNKQVSNSNMDDGAKKFVQNARRRIILKEEGS